MKTFDKILHFEILYKGKQIIFIQYQNHLAERFFQIKYQDKTIILYLIKAILLQNIKSDSYIIYIIDISSYTHDILTANNIKILVKFSNENQKKNLQIVG